MVAPGGCTNAYSNLVEGERCLGIRDVFHELRRDLWSIVHETKSPFVEKARVSIYAQAIKHLHLLRSSEEGLLNGDSKISHLLLCAEVRQDYGNKDEEFFKKYVPPNDVLRELAKIGRRKFKTPDKEQIKNFMELAKVHTDNYSIKYATLMGGGCTLF